MRLPALLGVVLLCPGCPWVSDKEWSARLDKDGDGAPIPEDCDPTDARISPSADERCDGVDNDCDGDVDEDGATDATAWHADADQDGFGSEAVLVQACEQPSEGVANGTDCDDTDPAVFPGATELCDLVDQDCDGEVWDPEDYITVSTDGSTYVGVWSSIRAGLVAAQGGGAGSVVCLADGAWSERVTLDGSLGDVSLIGVLGSASTYLDGGEGGTVLTITGASAATLIEGITITNGANTDYGGGLYLEDSSPLLRNLIVSGNQATYGGGIYISGGSPTLTGLVIVENSATGDGGGIDVDGDLALNNTRIQGNACWRKGGAVYVATGTTTASDLALVGNVANAGGGVAIGGSATLKVEGAQIAFNEADGGAGGALYLEEGSPTLDATWLDVRANGGSTGGGIVASGGGTLRITNGIFAANVSYGDYSFAGAINALDAQIDVAFSTFVANTTPGDGGAMALFASGAGTSRTALRDTSISENTATTAGSSEGGALYGVPAPTSINTCHFSANLPDDGLAYDDFGEGNLTDCATGFDISDADPTAWSLTPGATSCLIGAASDGTDIGAYGGPLGGSWPTGWP